MELYDHAQACFDALVGAVGITAEARDITGRQELTGAQSLHFILGYRFGHLSDREAYAACAHRYDVELPA